MTWISGLAAACRAITGNSGRPKGAQQALGCGQPTEPAATGGDSGEQLGGPRLPALPNALLEILVKILALALLDNTLPALKGSTSGTFAAFGYFSTLRTSTNRRYIRELHAMFGTQAPQQTTLSESDYDSIHLWAKAVQKARTASTNAVVKAMAGQTFYAPRGRMTVNGRTRHVAQHIYLGQAQPNGTYKIRHDFGLIKPGPQCAF
ncbi:MAG: transporter substrate-binding protein [Chloroflexota bacterium]